MMTVRTGKSGRYRYSTCAGAQSRGKTACEGITARLCDEVAAIEEKQVTSSIQEWRAPPGEDDNYVYSIAL